MCGAIGGGTIIEGIICIIVHQQKKRIYGIQSHKLQILGSNTASMNISIAAHHLCRYFSLT